MGRLFGELAATPSAPEVVADVVRTAENDISRRLRFRAGPDAEALLNRRSREDDAASLGGIRAMMSEPVEMAAPAASERRLSPPTALEGD